MPKSVVGVLFGWRNWFVKFSLLFFWILGPLYLLWTLWRERERGIFTFEDVEASVVHMKMSIITTFF